MEKESQREYKHFGVLVTRQQSLRTVHTPCVAENLKKENAMLAPILEHFCVNMMDWLEASPL
eukprot:3533617-Amphidinium_carterae.1